MPNLTIDNIKVEVPDGTSVLEAANKAGIDLPWQIATAIDEVLKPHGVAVLIEAEHTCMSIRGVTKPGASTVTTRFLGTFRDSTDDQLRFVTLARGAKNV